MSVQPDLADVVTLLYAWGRWSKEDVDRNRGYPVKSSICNAVEPATTSRKRNLTADGKQTRVMTARRDPGCPAAMMEIDYIVCKAPAKYQKTLHRRYRYLQRDGKAARQLHMEREAYTKIADAAVKYVAEKLEMRILQR